MKTLALTAALLAAICLAPVAGHADDDTTVTINVHEADLATVIAMIAEQAGKNIVVSPGVSGKVTVSFEDVSWRHALKTLAESMGYVVVKAEHGVLHVVPEAAARKVEPKVKPSPYLEEVDEVFRRGLAERERSSRRRLAHLRSQLAEATAQKKLDTARKLRDEIDRLTAELARMKEERDFADTAGATKALTDESRRLAEAHAKLRALEEELAAGANREVSVQMYDVRDLLEANPDLGSKTAAVAPGAQVEQKSGTLIVRGTATQQEVVGTLLSHLRRKQGAVEGNPLHDGRGELGSLWVSSARIQQLEEASRLLRAAGAKEEAERVLARARKLRAEAHARARAHHEAPARGGADLAGAIHGLRKDVHALREQVQELTRLVRQLLGRRGGR